MIWTVKYRWNAWTSLLLTAAFLLFGFCPLRNVLVRTVPPDPPRKAQPVPHYAKITSGKESVTFTLVNRTSAQPALSPGSIFIFAISERSTAVASSSAGAQTYFSNVPLYLRNRVLLI